MDVAALVTAGATTIVGLMASDAWTYASGRFARLLGRPDPAADPDGAAAQAELQLRASRAELLVARADGDEAAAARVEEGWRDRLRTALEHDPAAVRELTELLDDVNPDWRAARAVSVQNTTNTISGGTFNAQVFQGRDSTVTFSSRPPQGT
ncbi:hypothetical protein ACFWBF_30995 [Streptomyces sp. NPDC060028]|uniref:hypothetical protein n=1 Tax=Streptomyces sp. NPDC060028 TaxID=3347041 RepID=UPI00368F9846